MIRAAAVFLMVASSLAGCTREEPAPREDRTLSKLRDEVDRVNAGGAATPSPAEPHDPNANLTALAVGAQADRGTEGPLSLPSVGVAAKAGPVAVALKSAQTSHQLTTEKMTLTTEELFLKVVLTVRNDGKAAEPFSIERAKIVHGDQSWPIARDAHFLVGTRQVGFDAVPGETRELVLVFEVPPSALQADGLELSLPHPPGGNGDVRLRLK